MDNRKHYITVAAFRVRDDGTPNEGSGRLSSELLLTLLKNGSYWKHMETIRARLSRAMGNTFSLSQTASGFLRFNVFEVLVTTM
ncbi:MAG: hypothetical protein H8K06_08390 [Nitrospira sp.]|jgi:hypothetical protein|nr:hypothetical protein [Nitrospira sp.]